MAWRPVRPVEHGGRLSGVELGAARGAWRPARQRGDAADSGRPVRHVEARPAAWRLATARGCAAGGAGAATEAVARGPCWRGGSLQLRPPASWRRCSGAAGACGDGC
ncbi:Os10g0117200 [Oryza sativa Japonica Group]|nr:Os10g0117200 [Oryza sativa Japonica Group]